MLAIMFSLTFILLLYAKFCHRAASVHTANHQIHDGLPRSSRSPTPGVDKTVVESLPFFRFSSLKGSRDGLECAVCLAKFEDIDILRLLPRCKHAFHIDCIDQWLDKHSTCPLCRRKVGADDLSLQCSSSFRFLWNPPPDLQGRAEDSSLEQLELHVEREESHCGSNRFCIGSSFRKTDGSGGGAKDEELLPIPQSMDCDSPPPPLHRFNHKILVADAVLKNRWSNVSSSDIMFLNSEMLSDVSSERFSSMETRESEGERREINDEEKMMKIKDEMERKRAFEEKVKEIKRVDRQNNNISSSSSSSDSNHRTKLGFDKSSSNSVMNPNEKRSMSEIVIHPRFTELGNSINKDSINVKEERMRRLWLPIARKTVQWFANRERRSSSQLNV